MPGADVEILIEGRNNVGGAMRQAGASVENFERQHGKAMHAIEKKFDRMGGVAGKFGSIYGGVMGAVLIGSTVAATAAIVRFGKASVDAFASADEAVIRSASVFKGRTEEVLRTQAELKGSLSELKVAWMELKLATGEAIAPAASAGISALTKSLKGETSIGAKLLGGGNPLLAFAAQFGMEMTPGAQKQRRAEQEAAAQAKILENEERKAALIPQLVAAEQAYLSVRNQQVPNAEMLSQVEKVRDENMRRLAEIDPVLAKNIIIETDAKVKLAEATLKSAAAANTATAAFSRTGGGAGGITGTVAQQIAGIRAREEAQASAQSNRSSIFRASGVRKKAQGGMITQTGPHILEAGELVVPRSHATGNMGNITINVNGARSPMETAIAIKRQLATMGYG